MLPVLCETYGCNVLNAVVMDKDSVFFDGAPDEFRAHGIEDNFWLNDTEVGEGADLVAMSRRRDSSDGYDDEHDSSGDGGRSSGKCGDIGGRKPKVSNRHGKEVTREMKRNAEEMMKKARRYCEDVSIAQVLAPLE